MPPVIDRTKCIGCGMCADVCPLQVFRHDPERCSAGYPGLIWTIKEDKKEPAPVQDKAHGKPVLFDYGIKSCYSASSIWARRALNSFISL